MADWATKAGWFTTAASSKASNLGSITTKRIQRRQLPLTSRDFICGDMDCMHGAMKQLNIPVPPPVYFPDSLRAYLHREVWRDTVGGLRARIEFDGEPVFAKLA